MQEFRCVVVPTDFSTHARRAIERMARLPLAASCRLHVVHVLPAGASAELKANAAQVLDQLVARIAGRKTRTRRKRRVVGRLLEGQPHVEIIRYARSVDAELLVVGRKGAGRALRNALGTTVARIVQQAEIPVLIAGVRSPGGPYKRPLVAVEIDPTVRRIIQLVQKVVGAGRLKSLDLVHAYHVPFEGFLESGMSGHVSLHEQQVRENAEQAVAILLESLRDLNVKYNLRLVKGDARTAIFTEARRRRADLIALGTHGRSGIAHAMLGSVAEWVVSSVTQDVLIARPVRFTFRLP